MRLRDGAGGGESCYGFPLGTGGWVLTNLHCIENSLAQSKLVAIKQMRSAVRYRAVDLLGVSRQPQPLLQVTFPEIPDVGADGTFPGTELWATGAGYPILSDVEEYARGRLKGGSPLLEDWRRDAIDLPLEDFALLRVPGLQEDWSCLTTDDFARGGTILEQMKIQITRDRRTYAGWASYVPDLAFRTGDPDRFPFFVYAAASGLFFSDLPTEPGSSGLPVQNARGQTVALHSFGMSSPQVVSAEIPLARIGEVLRKRFPKVVVMPGKSRPECRMTPNGRTISPP